MTSRAAAIGVLAAAAPVLEVFTQELTISTEQVSVSAHGGNLFIVALSASKVVRAVVHAGDGTAANLTGNNIDTVVVYAAALRDLTICADRMSPRTDDAMWSGVPYLVKGLTLPVREADPKLTNDAQELAAAESRLVPAESLTNAEFHRVAPSLHACMGHPELGRPGERVLLMRSATDQPFEELSFANQLTLLQVHPRWRRILGFGYADLKSSGLVPGKFYEYRITGYFDSGDLADAIYDVHTVSSGTVLPPTFRIRDVRFTFARPVNVVVDPPAPTDALLAISRRGIAVQSATALLGWLLPSTDNWSAVIDLPRAVDRVILEVNAGHSFRYAAGLTWLFTAPEAPLPPSPVADLKFPSPVTQIRLKGTGTLYSLRIPAAGSHLIERLHVSTGAVPFAPQPLPVPPVAFQIANLQTPPAVLTGNLGDETPVAPRPQPGFKLEWLPAAVSGGTYWPDDLDSAPPIEAIAFQIEHRDVTPPSTFGPWTAIQGGDNLTVGTRDNGPPPAGLEIGADLSVLFPLRRPRSKGAGFSLHLNDVFDSGDPDTTFVRGVPALGTYHQYRMRAMDSVGRVSGTWILSNVERLEKHIPPPVPVGPEPASMVANPDGSTRLAKPTGPRARPIVAGDPGLTPGDRAILGTHKNAIVLEWGWRDNDRQIDPLAKEFRIYQWLRPPDMVAGEITAVAALADGWSLAFTTDRWLQTDECKGQWITTGGYPFLIRSHTAGSAITIEVEQARVNAAATPANGDALFGRPIAPEHQRPAFWDQRAAVTPITASVASSHIFYDLLTLTPAHPRDVVWVGVSAADAQSYIADELPAWVTNGGRPGNESSLAIAAVSARYFGRPVFSVPPPIGDVPELVTEEPTGRQVLLTLELPAMLPGVLPAGEPIALDRCPGDSVFAILSVSAASQIQLQMKDGSQQVITFLNPGDESTVLNILRSSHPELLPNRYLLYLVTHHVRPDEIFERTKGQTDTFGPAPDRLPPKPGRYFYRVRQADALGRVSEGGAIVPIVLRVPSVAPPAAPFRTSLTANGAGAHIGLRVPGDPELTHLLLFSTAVPFTAPSPDLAGAQLLRTPNRRDLYPADGIRLRTPGGEWLKPLVKSLSDPDVTIAADGARTAMVTLAVAGGQWFIAWAVALSRDGIPSELTGPFTIGVPS